MSVYLTYASHVPSFPNATLAQAIIISCLNDWNCSSVVLPLIILLTNLIMCAFYLTTTWAQDWMRSTAWPQGTYPSLVGRQDKYANNSSPSEGGDEGGKKCSYYRSREQGIHTAAHPLQAMHILFLKCAPHYKPLDWGSPKAPCCF